MDGFDAGQQVIPGPAVDVAPEVRARLVEVLAAMVCGKTPEEIAGYLEDGFPGEVGELLERPGERDEMAAHLDVILSVLQSPVETG
jgi:hypothetical protein